MKNVLFILVCLFTSQAFGQQTKRAGSQGKNQNSNSAASIANAPEREVTNTVSCPIKGVKIIVSKTKYSNGHDDDIRIIGVEGFAKTFYSDANALTNSIAPGIGLPTPSNSSIILQNFYDNDNPGYLRIDYVAHANSGATYCNEYGNKIKNSPVYRVSIGSNHQEYNGSYTTQTGGSQYDSYDYMSLAVVYNQHKQPQNTSIPVVCPIFECAPDVVVDGTPPDSKPFTYVDASGEVHTWFEGSLNGGGTVKPVIGIANNLHQQISLVAGAISNSFGDDVGHSGFVNQAIGAHLGLYVPLTTKYPVSVGVYVSGQYLASNKDGFRHQPAGFEVNGMPSTVKASSDAKIKQSIMMLGAGPQINFGLGRKISLSTILQGGVASFKQSGFSFIQEFKEGDMTIPVEIFNQEETKSANFFWTPRLKISYALSSKIGIWAEGNYMMGEIEANQSQLNPGEPRNDDGKYSFGQVNSASQVEGIKKFNLKGPGVGVGLKFSLSK